MRTSKHLAFGLAAILLCTASLWLFGSAVLALARAFSGLSTVRLFALLDVGGFHPLWASLFTGFFALVVVLTACLTAVVAVSGIVQLGATIEKAFGRGPAGAASRPL